MDNQELLEQILAAMDRNQAVLRQEMAGGYAALQKEMVEGQAALRKEMVESQAALRKDIIDQMVAAMNEQTEMLTRMVTEKVSEAETRLHMKIEHDVSHKIEALFDGYKLAHEKQWELERRIEQFQLKIDEMETRLAVLEGKSA